MNQLSLLLVEFERTLIHIKAPVLERLKEGIDSIELYNVEFPLFPPEVEALYNWKDGTIPSPDDRMGTLWLFRSMIFLRIEEAVQLHNVMADHELGWRYTHFPLFQSGGGEYLLIDCDKSSATYNMLLFHSIGALDFEMIITRYDSLYSLFTSANQCIKEGIYYYENDILQSNYKLEYEVFKKGNPRSDYWKLYK